MNESEQNKLIFYETAFSNSVKFSYYRSGSGDDFDLKSATEIISHCAFPSYILTIDGNGKIMSVKPTNDTISEHSKDTKDTKDRIVLSYKEFEHYLRSYYLVSSSNSDFYIILCNNWSKIPDESRCKRLWEKWGIFIQCIHPFSYESLDWSSLQALCETPTSYVAQQERNRIIIEILKNRDKWIYEEEKLPVSELRFIEVGI